MPPDVMIVSLSSPAYLLATCSGSSFCALLEQPMAPRREAAWGKMCILSCPAPIGDRQLTAFMHFVYGSRIHAASVSLLQQADAALVPAKGSDVAFPFAGSVLE
jgi:hypothetical protein